MSSQDTFKHVFMHPHNVGLKKNHYTLCEHQIQDPVFI